MDFKLEHTGTLGRLPVGVQDPTTDVVVDAPLSDCSANTWNISSLGPSPERQHLQVGEVNNG